MAAHVEGHSPASTCATGRHFPGIIAMLFVTLPVVALDQASKWYIRSHFRLYEDLVIVPNWFDITYTRNPGAAFSMLGSAPAWFRDNFLIGLSALAIVVLLWLLVRAANFSLNTLALALILGGAAGNLIDRARWREVVDFILVHYYNHNYPVFNLADSAITIGVGLIALEAFRKGPQES
jgi:signal peptidase II